MHAIYMKFASALLSLHALYKIFMCSVKFARFLKFACYLLSLHVFF